MNDCKLVPTGAMVNGRHEFLCPACGRKLRAKYADPSLHRRTCTTEFYLAESSQTTGGPGAELHRLLGFLGITDSVGCDCGGHINEMNRQGPDWCEENEEQIVGWLRKSAEKRGLPFVEFLARKLIRMSVKRARRSAAAE